MVASCIDSLLCEPTYRIYDMPEGALPKRFKGKIDLAMSQEPHRD